MSAPELLHVWTSIQRAGATVVTLRYSERDHLAVAVVRGRSGAIVHAAGYDPVSALDVCLQRLRSDAGAV